MAIKTVRTKNRTDVLLISQIIGSSCPRAAETPVVAGNKNKRYERWA
jgi:hypothetical protein